MSADTTSKKTETKASNDSSSDSGSDSGSSSSSSSTKKESAPARTTSYFSSVSTDDYRAGWEGIFGKPKKKTSPKGTAKSASKKNGKRAASTLKTDLAVTLDLDHADLDADLKKHLEDAVRQHAKSGKTRLTRALKNDKVRWRLECRVID